MDERRGREWTGVSVGGWVSRVLREEEAVGGGGGGGGASLLFVKHHGELGFVYLGQLGLPRQSVDSART